MLLSSVSNKLLFVLRFILNFSLRVILYLVEVVVVFILCAVGFLAPFLKVVTGILNIILVASAVISFFNCISAVPVLLIAIALNNGILCLAFSAEPLADLVSSSLMATRKMIKGRLFGKQFDTFYDTQKFHDNCSTCHFNTE